MHCVLQNLSSGSMLLRYVANEPESVNLQSS